MEMELEKETFDCFLTPQDEELIWLGNTLEYLECELTFWQAFSGLQTLLLLLQMLLA